MQAKGFKGPFGIACDGIPAVIVFHGPDVPSEPAWLEGPHSPFRSGVTVEDLCSTAARVQETAGRVLDCKAFCSNSPMFVLDEPGALVQQQLELAQVSDGSGYRDRFPADARRFPCLLAYPLPQGPPPAGPQAIAQCTEDLWNIYLFADHLYFVRSWTGTLRYRAHVLFREGGMFITGVEAPADSSRADPIVSVLQVDFLVKSLLYRVLAPAPVPRELGPNTGRIAYYALTEYGRWGWYPSFDDTTTFRLWLNGAVGWFGPSPGHLGMLEAIRAVEANDSQPTREALYAELGRGKLYQPLVFEGGQVATGAPGAALSLDTRVVWVVQSCDGRPCFRGYTDPTLRLERGGYIEVSASALCSFVLGHHPEAGLVLNPGGPYSCVLSRQEIAILARAG
jgi:hypothetical protein